MIRMARRSLKVLAVDLKTIDAFISELVDYSRLGSNVVKIRTRFTRSHSKDLMKPGQISIRLTCQARFLPPFLTEHLHDTS